MDTNNELLISEIKSTVEKEYGKPFAVLYFMPAKDETYSRILTLSDHQGIIFNAFQYSDNHSISDDYTRAIINNKITDYMKAVCEIPSAITVNIVGILKNGSRLTYNFATAFEPNHDLTKEEFLKVIAIVRVNDEIRDHANDIYRLYKALVVLNVEQIEFNAISTAQSGDDLSKTIHNPLAYYENDWDRFKEIKSVLVTKNMHLHSADELIREGQNDLSR